MRKLSGPVRYIAIISACVASSFLFSSSALSQGTPTGPAPAAPAQTPGGKPASGPQTTGNPSAVGLPQNNGSQPATGQPQGSGSPVVAGQVLGPAGQPMSPTGAGPNSGPIFTQLQSITSPNADATQPVSAAPLELFGYSFFAQARAAIDARRQALKAPPPQPTINRPQPVAPQIIAPPVNPLVTPTGPTAQPQTQPQPQQPPRTTDQAVPGTVVQPTQFAPPLQGETVDALRMVVGPDIMQAFNVAGQVSDRYQLGPGDVITLRYYSPTLEPVETNQTVDSRGSITLPLGERLVVRGMTLQQAETTIQRRLSTKIRQVTVSLNLDRLRTMQITIAGESYAPGAYQMPASATLFNALYASGGPSFNGTMRRITLKRNDGTVRHFDLYGFLRNGDNAEDTTLQPGDVIFIPIVQTRVTVKGEVFEPAIYELTGTETLRDAIRLAGGLKPTGVAQRVSIESVQPGAGRQMIDANMLARTPANNPRLYSGDVVNVLSIRPIFTNQITVEGAVDQPGRYALTPGLTIAGLIDRARGLLPDAYPVRADLFRTNPDNTQQLVQIDLQRVLRKDPTANYSLMPQDRLIIYSVKDVQFLGYRTVEIAGAVQKPGSYYRADNMKLYDLLLQAGGTLPDAYLDQAFLQRRFPDNRLGPLVKVDIRQVMAHDASANLTLQDRDTLSVYNVREASFMPLQVVEVTGAVQKPGSYPRSDNMRVKDLLNLAGNPLPTAYTQRAFIQRTNPDGTVGPLLKVDLDQAAAGDPANNLELQYRDRLVVYTRVQVQYQPQQIVTVNGAVQAPGVYARAEHMHLSDLLQLGGGLKPEVGTRIEIAHARTDQNAVPDQVQLSPTTFQPATDPELLDGDVVVVSARGAFQDRPRLVTVSGLVNSPGDVVIKGTRMRLSDVIRDAGGLMPDAYPEGMVFTRTPALLSTAGQNQTALQITKLFDAYSVQEQKRQAAQLEIQRLKIIGGNKSGTGGLPVAIPGVTPASPDQSAPSAAETKAADALLALDLVSPARTLTQTDLTPTGNVSANLARALRNPGKDPNDIYVADGDTIVIPSRPSTVQVLGDVVAPHAVPFEANAHLSYYISQSGGYAPGAAIDRIMVLRVGGGVIPVRVIKEFRPGDVILVPTKVLAMKLGNNTAEIDHIFQGLGTTALIVLAAKKLFGL